MTSLLDQKVLTPFNKTSWLQVASSNPAAEITIAPRDESAYSYVYASLLKAKGSEQERAYLRVLNSDEYNYSFKRKLTTQLYHRVGNLWAYATLNSFDLFVFLANHYYDIDWRRNRAKEKIFDAEELEVLASNSSLVKSLGTSYDSLRFICYIFSEDLDPESLLPLVASLIKNHSMTLTIAESMVALVVEDAPMLEIPVEKYEVIKTLAEWIAEAYQLEYFSTKFMLQFLSATSSDK